MIGSLFAGPSLYGIARTALQDFDLHPPAGCGDLLRLVRKGIRTIGLVDGIFETVPSVWHKEILAALSEGVTIYGAASIGALRAAECHQFGMIGVGRIFEDYRDEIRTADADVALIHGPEELGFQPLTLPLVDVESLIRNLVDVALLEKEEAAEILGEARRQHFKSRTWNSIRANVGTFGSRRSEQVFALVGDSGFSQKREDLLALVKLMRDHHGNPDIARGRTNFSLSRTGFLSALETRIAGSGQTG